jgi:glycosyltransferase involved in cell wall biosynthesis
VETRIDPLVSLIVPVYNQASLLPVCVDSILAQTYGNLELLLVDDGSSDGSAALCDTYAARDARVRVVHQANAGISAARNRGLDEARGDLLGFADHDDWLEPDMLERLVADLADPEVDLAICGVVYEWPDRSKPWFAGTSRVLLTPAEARREMFVASGRFTGFVWDRLVRRSAVGGVRFSAGTALFEDLLFDLDVLARCRAVSFDSRIGYHWRQRAESTFHAHGVERVRRGFEGYDLVLERLAGREPEVRRLAENAYVLKCIEALKAFSVQGDGGAFVEEARRRLKMHGKGFLRGAAGRSDKVLFVLARIGYGIFRTAYRAGRKR